MQLDLFEPENTLIVPAQPVSEDEFYRQLAAQLDELYDSTIRLASSQAKNTRDTYSEGQRNFFNWCERKGINPSTAKNPELLICAMITDWTHNYTYKASTITTWTYAVLHWYQSRGVRVSGMSPGIRKTLFGMYRLRTRAVNRKHPATLDRIKEFLARIPKKHFLRDKSLILMGYTGAFRANELLSIKMSQVEVHRDGYIITVPRSKSDQQGYGITKIIPYGTNPDTCPVRALQDWLEYSGIKTGYLYRPCIHRQYVDQPITYDRFRAIIKYLAQYDEDVSTHSLRAGFVTEASSRDATEYEISQQTGHVDMASVRCYIRKGQSFRNSAATKLGL